MLEKILEISNNIANSLSEALGQSSLLIGFGVYIGFILIYSGFFWNFHKIISKKDFHISLVEKYINDKEQDFGNIMLWVLKLIKYIIVFPAILLFWFLIFALFLLFLSNNNDVRNVLLIIAAMIISIRIMAYSQEELSRNISKIVPFTLLAIFIINPSFSDLGGFLSKLNLVKDLINNSSSLIIFIFLSEIVLRIFNLTPRTLRYIKARRKEEVAIKKPVKKIIRMNKTTIQS